LATKIVVLLFEVSVLTLGHLEKLPATRTKPLMCMVVVGAN
jgi:hypothetical protein